jgi:hypothetical protein
LITQETGTHRSEGLSARGSASENDIGIVVLVHAEEALQCRFVANPTGEFESVAALLHGHGLYVLSIRTVVVSGRV